MTTIQEQFKDLFSECVTTVGVLTFVCQSKYCLGVLINSFTSLSVDPLLICFNLAKKSYAFQKFDEVDKCVLNILSSHQSKIAQEFIKPKDVNWLEIPHSLCDRGIPLVHDSLGSFDLNVREKIFIGDHCIVVAEVQNVFKNTEKHPLLYCKRQFINS